MNISLMNGSTIVVGVKPETVPGSPDLITAGPHAGKIENVTMLPITGGGMKATIESAQSGIINPLLMASDSVQTGITASVSINSELSAHEAHYNFLCAAIYSFANSVVGGRHKINAKTAVTVTAETVNGESLYKVVTADGVFGTTQNGAIKWQWLRLNGFTGSSALRKNNTTIQIYKRVDDKTIYVKQPLTVCTGIADIEITGEMVRNGIPLTTLGPDGVTVVGDVHPTFTVLHSYNGADEPLLLMGKGSMVDSFTLNVSAKAIITSTATMKTFDPQQIDYEKTDPFIRSYTPQAVTPSMSAGSAATMVYVDGIPSCVKDYSFTLANLVDTANCVGVMGEAGGSYKLLAPEIKATEYFNKSRKTLRDIYDFSTGAWTPRMYTVRAGDAKGHYILITVARVTISGDYPEASNNISEIAVSGRGSMFLDEDAVNDPNAYSEEKQVWEIQVDRCYPYVAP
jgi:Phage tail tube protein